MAHISQSRPDSGLGLQVKVLKTLQGVSSSLCSGRGAGPGGSSADRSLAAGNVDVITESGVFLD